MTVDETLWLLVLGTVTGDEKIPEEVIESEFFKTIIEDRKVPETVTGDENIPAPTDVTACT